MKREHGNVFKRLHMARSRQTHSGSANISVAELAETSLSTVRDTLTP
jgi:hypothetical protein